MIKYIVHTVSSKKDGNGNTYHYCHIVPTDTSLKSFTFVADGPTNGASMLRKELGLSWSDVYDAYSSDMPIRRFNAKIKGINLYEYELNRAKIESLFKRGNQGVFIS